MRSKTLFIESVFHSFRNAFIARCFYCFSWHCCINWAINHPTNHTSTVYRLVCSNWKRRTRASNYNWIELLHPERWPTESPLNDPSAGERVSVAARSGRRRRRRGRAELERRGARAGAHRGGARSPALPQSGHRRHDLLERQRRLRHVLSFHSQFELITVINDHPVAVLDLFILEGWKVKLTL